MASAVVRGSRPLSLERLRTDLTRPSLYLSVFGALQLTYLVLVRAWLGAWLPAAAALGLLALLALLARPALGWRWKGLALAALIVLMSVAPMVVAMIVRQHAGLGLEYDGMTQDEISVDRLMHGRPIYGVGFAGTAMEGYRWIYGGIGLRHYQHLPLMPLAGVPVRAVADLVRVPFDYRMVLLVMTAVAGGAVMALPVTGRDRFLIGVALFLDPLVAAFLLTGHDDICMLAMLLVGLACLARGHPLLASLAVGTAAAFKPFALMAFPFVLLALWLQGRWRWRRGLVAVVALAGPLMVTVVPFLLIDATGFWRDVVQLGTGSGPDAYPISGFGFPALLLGLGVLHRSSDPYPALPLQLATVIPVTWLGVRAVAARPTIARLLAASLAAMLTFLVFARFFSDNYLASLLALAACVPALRHLAIPSHPGSRMS